jgi:hypothetical protein
VLQLRPCCPALTCCHLCLHLLLQPDRVIFWLAQLRLGVCKEAHSALAAHAVRAHLQPHQSSSSKQQHGGADQFCCLACTTGVLLTP